MTDAESLRAWQAEVRAFEAARLAVEVGQPTPPAIAAYLLEVKRAEEIPMRWIPYLPGVFGLAR